MTTTVEVVELADWSSPKKILTKKGPKILRTAYPISVDEEFRSKLKHIVKSTPNLSWGKDLTGDWQICWWEDDKSALDSIEASSQAAPAKPVTIDAPAGQEYLPYQKAGIQYAAQRKNTLIADEMGLGKTIQAIGVINSDPAIQSVLIVCPASIKINWSIECAKWLTRDLSVGIQRKGNFPDTDVVIINYDVAMKFWERLHAKEWDLVVLDESHYCKNSKAQRTKAILGGKDYEPIRAKRKIALTGTPILNRPIEAQPVLGWLDEPNFGNFFKFAKKYCDAHQTRWGWDFTGHSNLDQLQTLLRSTVMIRRLKKDVLTEIPPKRRQVVVIPENGCAAAVNSEREAYQKWEERLNELKLAVEVAKILEDKEDYRKAVAELEEAVRSAFTEMARERHNVALAKVDYVVDHIANIIENETPVVVFAHHRDVIDGIRAGLKKKKIDSVKLVGGMTEAHKQAAIEDFQGHYVNVFIGNIKAAGVGITLTRSSHVVFAELDWVPANMSQAEDRCHRIGQNENVLIQHLVLENSIDQNLAEKLVIKQDISDRALDDTVSIEKSEPLIAVTVEKKEHVSTEKEERVYTESEIADFLKKLRYLSSVCDGAHEWDGCGFNRFDSAFGKALAARETLSQRQAAIAERLTVKYRRQLEVVK